MGTLTFGHVKAELQWKEAYNSYLSGKTEKALSQYKEIYTQLKTDRYFLYNYSAELYQAKKYGESLNIALQCRQYWADYDLELMIGKIYQQQKYFLTAESYYKSASMMCPSRFIPLYQLFKLYKQFGKNEQAYEIAKKIVKKPIKISSMTIRMMQREMEKEIFKFECAKQHFLSCTGLSQIER